MCLRVSPSTDGDGERDFALNFFTGGGLNLGTTAS